jgi:hypothetical protein
MHGNRLGALVPDTRLAHAVIVESAATPGNASLLARLLVVKNRRAGLSWVQVAAVGLAAPRVVPILNAVREATANPGTASSMELLWAHAIVGLGYALATLAGRAAIRATGSALGPRHTLAALAHAAFIATSHAVGFGNTDATLALLAGATAPTRPAAAVITANLAIAERLARLLFFLLLLLALGVAVIASGQAAEAEQAQQADATPA